LYVILISAVYDIRTALLILLDLITLRVKGRSYETSHNVVFTNLPSLPPSYYKYSPQHPVLKHPQSIFLPQCVRPSFSKNPSKVRGPV